MKKKCPSPLLTTTTMTTTTTTTTTTWATTTTTPVRLRLDRRRGEEKLQPEVANVETKDKRKWGPPARGGPLASGSNKEDKGVDKPTPVRGNSSTIASEKGRGSG